MKISADWGTATWDPSARARRGRGRRGGRGTGDRPPRPCRAPGARTTTACVAVPALPSSWPRRRAGRGPSRTPGPVRRAPPCSGGDRREAVGLRGRRRHAPVPAATHREPMLCRDMQLEEDLGDTRVGSRQTFRLGADLKLFEPSDETVGQRQICFELNGYSSGSGLRLTLEARLQYIQGMCLALYLSNPHGFRKEEGLDDGFFKDEKLSAGNADIGSPYFGSRRVRKMGH